MPVTTPHGRQLKGIVLLRQSDYREEGVEAMEARRDELLDLGHGEGITDIIVMIENDLDSDSKQRGKSAHKETVQHDANGLIISRTDRPVFQEALRIIQRRERDVLITGDESRISRNWRDGADALDAIKAGRGYILSTTESGKARWVLTEGATDRDEEDRFLKEIEAARQYSVAVASKVARGRRRWAGKSYHGGVRPAGYDQVADTKAHERTLVIREAEAEVFRWAHDLLMRKGISLTWLAADLRERGVPTPNGGTWGASALRDMLLKPTLGGFAVKCGSRAHKRDHPVEELVPATAWEPVIAPDDWLAMRAFLMDPARVTTTGNEPRWLLSGIAECKHGGPITAQAGGSKRKPSYVSARCDKCSTRRLAEWVDDWVTEHVIGILTTRPGVLMPPEQPQAVDLKPLRDELARLDKKFAATGDRYARDVLDDVQYDEQVASINKRKAEINEILAAPPVLVSEPDPIPEFRGKDAEVVWATLTMPRKRHVLTLLIESVVIHPSTSQGRQSSFDPTSVTVTPKVF